MNHVEENLGEIKCSWKFTQLIAFLTTLSSFIMCIWHSIKVETAVLVKELILCAALPLHNCSSSLASTALKKDSMLRTLTPHPSLCLSIHIHTKRTESALGVYGQSKYSQELDYYTSNLISSMVKESTHCCFLLWRALKQIEMKIPYYLVIPLLRIYPKNKQTLIQRDIYTHMFIAALLKIANKKSSLCPLKDDWSKSSERCIPWNITLQSTEIV